jgi:hypothetical protein
MKEIITIFFIVAVFIGCFLLIGAVGNNWKKSDADMQCSPYQAHSYGDVIGKKPGFVISCYNDAGVAGPFEYYTKAK